MRAPNEHDVSRRFPEAHVGRRADARHGRVAVVLIGRRHRHLFVVRYDPLAERERAFDDREERVDAVAIRHQHQHPRKRCEVLELKHRAPVSSP
jgi:hypothetical protein